jgi:hypothetical protein
VPHRRPGPRHFRARAPSAYISDAMLDLGELCDEPLAVARQLLDPWIAAFCKDDSVWQRI